LEINPIHKTLQSSCYPSAPVTSPTPGFAALPDTLPCISHFICPHFYHPAPILLVHVSHITDCALP